MTPQTNAPCILIIVNRLFEWSQNFITRELAELKQQGVRLAVCAREIVVRDDLTDREESLKSNFFQIPEIPLNFVTLSRVLGFVVAHPRVFLRACRGFSELKHHSVTKKVRSIVCLFRAVEMVKFCLKQEVQLIHAHFLTAPGETAFYLSLLTDIPFSATGYAMDIYQDNSGLRRKLRKAVFINTHTKFNLKYLLDNVDSGLQNLVTFYTGIDCRSMPPIEIYDKSETVFLAVGRLVEKKGFDFLIEACHLLNQKKIGFKCILVGKGPLSSRLRKKISDLGLSHAIEMKDYVAPNRLSEVYQSCDVLVVPSVVANDKDIDGLPTVCFEAMAYGRPVIGSNLSGIPEIVENGKNGYLVEPGDPHAIAEAMIKLTDFTIRRKMSEQARKTVSEKFDLKKNVGDLKLKMEEITIRV